MLHCRYLLYIGIYYFNIQRVYYRLCGQEHAWLDAATQSVQQTM